MIPRVAGIGSSSVPLSLVVSPRSICTIREQDAQTIYAGSRSAVVLSRFTVALVLLLLPVVVLRAQQAQQWPQDDTYDDTQSGSQQQSQPQYGRAQGYPQQGIDDPQQGYPQSTPQGYDQQPYAQESQSGQMQGLNAEQLEQLVAPVALYPDALLAQTLAASTYPAQISTADQWLRSMGNAPPEQIAAAASAQTSWDPSVKALTAYPQVLDMLNQNLQWATALGNAYYNQPQDLLQVVQVMRQRAQSSGNLQSTPQEQVTTNPGYIAVAPTNPQMVYVPTYNPWVVYGQPVVAYPGYTPLYGIGAVVGTAVQYGLGFAVGAFFHTPFGLLSWGLDWFGNAILFNHGPWYSHSVTVADWGFPHGGPRAFRGGEFARYGDHYGRGGWNSYRNEQGFNRAEGRFPVARPAQGFENRSQGGYNRQTYQGRELGGSSRGYPGYGGQTHPAMPQQYASNRMPAAIGRPQPYQGAPQGLGNRSQVYGNGFQSYGARPQQFSAYGQRPGYGSSPYARPMENYAGGRSLGYSAHSQSYRAPTPSFGHGFSRPPANAFAGSYGQPGHSGGFHSFGGGHNSSPSFGGGGRSFGGGHSSGGHSSGGGHGHHH
jgi:Protein of unknown function (DUF3300)